MRLSPALACLAVALAGALGLAAEPAKPTSATPPVSRFDALKPKLWSKDKAEREKAYEAYLKEGAEGRKQLAADLLAVRASALAACRELSLADETQKRLLAAHKKLTEARTEALRVIFDRKVYPDENHGRVGQPIVDKAVAAVKAEHPAYRRAFDPVVRRLERVLRAYERLRELDAQLDQLGAKEVDLNPPLEKLVSCDPELLKLLQDEAAFVDACERVLRYNRLLRTTASDAERRLVDLTNEYRMQLGIRPFALSEPLTQAARKHSQEMQRLGYFGHGSPTPANASPEQRCANEGYTAYCGENCASGGGPDAAFKMWYNSSGHHRNMLNPGANEIGVGQAGPWTEDFGARRGLDLDNPPRTLPKPPPPPAKDAPKRK